MLHLVIGALVVVVLALGLSVWRQESKPASVELRVDDNGLSIQQN